MIYVDWNGIERSINIYWNDTKKIKIKYRLWHEEADVEAYDINGKVIFQKSAGLYHLKLHRLNIKNGRLRYVVDKKKVDEWSKKLDCLKKTI